MRPTAQVRGAAPYLFASKDFIMLLDGFNHVALLTSDSKRLHVFYQDMFDAEIGFDREEQPGIRLSTIYVGPLAELNVFEIEGNHEADHQTPMFGRGRLDHMALRAPDIDSFTEIRRRLMARGAAGSFVTDFGPVLSLFFRDPDGLEGEVTVANPDALPGVHNPPGTAATRFATAEESAS